MNAALPLAPVDAELFLAALDPTATTWTFQTFDDNPAKRPELARTLHGTLSQHAAELARLNAAGAGVFITPNETDGTGRKAENITHVRAAWADFDDPVPDTLERLRDDPLPPSIIVESSPGKLHAYWLADGVALGEFKPLQQAIAHTWGSDPKVCDLPRVMRLPGFQHRKGEPQPVTLLEAPCHRYSRAELREHYPPAPTPAPAPTPSQQAPAPSFTDKTSRYGAGALARACETIAAAADGTRNATLNSEAHGIARLVAGGEIETGEAWSTLEAAAERAGLEAGEIAGTLHSAFTSGLAKPRTAGADPAKVFAGGAELPPSASQAPTGEAAPVVATLEAVRHAVHALHADAGAIFAPGIFEALRIIKRTDCAEFYRLRRAVRESRAVPLSEFDRGCWSSSEEEETGDKSIFTEDDPWPEPVDGAALLTDIAAAIGRFVIADKETIDAAALWSVFTWLLDEVQVAPIANITAPEKRCGKTILLSVLGKLAYRPMQVADIATAALFRSIELWSPALLIDEVDAFLNDNEEARGIINAGFTRDSAFVIRCVGDDHIPTKFNVWGAKALCGIGKIADTLADRSIPLRLRRKKPGESAERLRHSDPALWESLRQRIARWAEDNAAAVAAARPAIIEGLNDRANDCWEPLLAITDAAGGAWPHRARHAATVLHGLEEETPTIGAELLADIRDVFDRLGGEAIFGETLLGELIREEDKPWATWNRGTAMRRNQLAKKLGEYGITSGTVRVGAATKKGFRREQFLEAWERYAAPLPPS